MTDATEPTSIAAPRMFILTRYTREAGKNRISVIQGFEVPLRRLILVLIGLGAAVVPTVFAAVLFGYWAVLVPVLIVGGLLFLMESRSRDGLRVPMWKAIKHRHQEPVDQFLCGGKPVDPLATGYFRVVPSSVPVHRDPPDLADMFAPLPAAPAGQAVLADHTVDLDAARPAGPNSDRPSRIRRSTAGALRQARRLAGRITGRPHPFFDLGAQVFTESARAVRASSASGGPEAADGSGSRWQPAVEWASRALLLAGMLVLLLMLVGVLPAAADNSRSSANDTGPVTYLADNAGSSGTQRDPCGQIVDPTQSKANADARPYLPLSRWSDVASGLHDRLDADFWEDIYSKIQRRLMFSNMLAAGNALWNVSANIASAATVFCPLQEAGQQADEVAASFATAVRGTPILTGVFVAVVGAAFWQAYRRRSAGAAAKALARPVLVMALIMVMALGASASTATTPGTGSPWWFASKLNSAVNTVAGSLTNSFASTTPSGALADGLLTDPNSNLTCSKMLDELHNKYEQTYGSARVQQLSAAVPLTLSKMWEQTGLTAWARVQFGQAADNANTARVFCRLLESRLGMTDTGTELSLSQLSGAGLPPPGPVVFSGLNADDRHIDQTMIAWAACDWDGHQFTVPVTSPNNWSQFSLGGESGGGGTTDSGTSAVTPDACQKWWTAQDYDSSGLDQAFNLEDDPQFIGAETARTGQTGIQDFLLSWHGNITADAMITSGTYGLSSLVMLIVYGGMSLGIIVAKVAMMVMLALVFLAAFLSLWVGGTGRASRLAQFTKYFIGLVVFVFGITVTFNLINLVSLFMTSIGTGIFSQGSFMAIVWSGFSPVIAVIVLHLLFKHLLRAPSPFKPSGALAWAGAVGGIGAAAAVGFDRLSYRGRSVLSDFAGGAWRRGRRTSHSGPQDQSDSKGQTRGASAAVNAPDEQAGPGAGQPSSAVGTSGRVPDGQIGIGSGEDSAGQAGAADGANEGVDLIDPDPSTAIDSTDIEGTYATAEPVKPDSNGQQAQAPTESTASPAVTAAAIAARAGSARRQQVRDRAATAAKAIWRHKAKIAVGTVLAMPVLGLPALSVVGAVSAAGTAIGAAGTLACAVGGAAAASPFAATVAAASLVMARRHIRDRRSMAQAANAGPTPQAPKPQPAGDQPATPNADPGGTHPDGADNGRTAEPGTALPESSGGPEPAMGPREGAGMTGARTVAPSAGFRGGNSPTPRRRSDPGERGAYTFPDLEQTGTDAAGDA